MTVDPLLVKLELLARHVHRLAEELEQFDDKITELMFVSGASQVPARGALAAFSARLERIRPRVPGRVFSVTSHSCAT
jgi:hypothetical protein